MSLSARHLNWLLILVCWALYALAFAFPAVAQDKYPRLIYDPALLFPDPASGRWPSFEKTVVQDFSGLSGRDAFKVSWVFRQEVWLANPALWLGTIFLAWRAWSCAAFVAVIGFGLALLTVNNAVPSNTELVYGAGYWLWVASLAALLAGSLAGGVFVPRQGKRTPAELFRGWRGVALRIWLGAAVVVFVAWWEWHKDVSPPLLWRAGIITAWMALGLMALAVEQLKDSRRPRLWPMLVVWNLVVFALIALAMWWFWSDIYPPRPPR
jgi:hypothetical protein